VAVEFALVGSPRTVLERLAGDGHRGAARIARILAEPRVLDRFVAVCQVGITIASLGLGMYGEHAIAERLAGWFADLGEARWFPAHALASVAAVAGLTYLHLVLGEMLPKSIALANPPRVALRLTWPMLACYWLFYPLAAALDRLSNQVVRLLGVQRQHGSPSRYFDSADLRDVVEDSKRRGLIAPEAGEVLRDLLAFGERRAGDAMVPRVRIRGIELGTSAGELRELLALARHTRYPVFEGDLDHVTGVVHVKDLFRLLERGQPLGREAARKVPFVPATARLDEVIAAMRNGRSHVVIVMDEHGGTSGLLTFEDLLEEVVGSIDEEAAPAARADRPGVLRVPGTTRLDELGELLHRRLEHDETSTISGLVLMMLGRPARVGDVVHWRDVRFEVTDVAGRGVKEARVTAP
jgi:CBS domain containing-hemolysin-like protein